MTVRILLSPDPRVWVPVPIAWPTAQHPSAAAWAREAGPALVADQGVDDAALGERLGIVLASVAAMPHPDHVQARFLHLPDVRAGFMLLEVSAVETAPSANRHLVHRALTEADREPGVGAVQVEAVALPDGRPLLRVLRFERPSSGDPLIGILRHAVRLPAAPGVRGAVDVVTTITGSDIEGLLRTLGDVETLLEDIHWSPDDGEVSPNGDAVRDESGPARDKHLPASAEEKENVWTAS